MKVSYIKVCQISSKSYEVGCEYEDGEYQVDRSFKNSVAAEKHAEKLAKHCNCDWGCDY